MIAAFNANGSPAHSLFSTGSWNVSRDLWVITLHELTLDYRVTLAHHSFSSSISMRLFPRPLPVSICTGRQEPHREGEIVSQLWCQTASDGCTVSLQTEWQTIWALSCHCGAWPRTVIAAWLKLPRCYSSLRGAEAGMRQEGGAAALRRYGEGGFWGWLTCRERESWNR